MQFKILPTHNSVNYAYYILITTMAGSLIALIAAVIYIVHGAKACPLCLLQQVIFILVFIIACLGLIIQRHQSHNNLSHWLIIITSLIGLIVAAWQIYTQLNPSEHTCGLTVEQLFAFLSLSEALIQMFLSSDCSEINAYFLGISLAWYSAFIYLAFLLINLSALRVNHRNQKPFNNKVSPMWRIHYPKKRSDA